MRERDDSRETEKVVPVKLEVKWKTRKVSLREIFKGSNTLAFYLTNTSTFSSGEPR